MKKRLFAFLLSLCLVAGLVPAAGLIPDASASFDDIDDVGISYKEAVDVLIGAEVVDGMTNEILEPGGAFTREMLAKIIAYMTLTPGVARELDGGDAAFTDVEADRWSAGAIAYCVENGIITGMGDGTFSPAGTLTGYEMAKVLLSAVGYGAAGEYESADWQIYVQRDADRAHLFDGDPSIAESDAVSREQGMLACFNAFTSASLVTLGEQGGYIPRRDGDGNSVTLASEMFEIVKEYGAVTRNDALNGYFFLFEDGDWHYTVEFESEDEGRRGYAYTQNNVVISDIYLEDLPPAPPDGYDADYVFVAEADEKPDENGYYSYTLVHDDGTVTAHELAEKYNRRYIYEAEYDEAGVLTLKTVLDEDGLYATSGKSVSGISEDGLTYQVDGGPEQPGGYEFTLSESCLLWDAETYFDDTAGNEDVWARTGLVMDDWMAVLIDRSAGELLLAFVYGETKWTEPVAPPPEQEEPEQIKLIITVEGGSLDDYSYVLGITVTVDGATTEYSYSPNFTVPDGAVVKVALPPDDDIDLVISPDYGELDTTTSDDFSSYTFTADAASGDVEIVIKEQSQGSNGSGGTPEQPQQGPEWPAGTQVIPLKITVQGRTLQELIGDGYLRITATVNGEDISYDYEDGNTYVPVGTNVKITLPSDTTGYESYQGAVNFKYDQETNGDRCGCSFTVGQVSFIELNFEFPAPSARIA